MSHMLMDLQDPVVTPDGFLYSKEAIYESLLAQRKANKRKQAAWDEQQLEDGRKVRVMLASNACWSYARSDKS